MDQADGPISARAAEQNRDSKLSRATATSRRHPAPGLMALRVFAMVLVLIGHSAATYTIMRDPSLPWILFEPLGSQTLDILGFACRELALPLFFLLAGISAEYGATRKSAWEFLAPRLSRLVVPLLLAGLTLFPLTGAIWLYGLKVGNTNHMTDAQRVTLEMRLDASNPLQWGLLHLWFLEYLLLITAIYSISKSNRFQQFCQGKTRLAMGQVANWLLDSPFRPLLITVPVFGLLCCDLRPWADLHRPLIPRVSDIVFFAVFFVMGTWIARGGILRRRRRWTHSYLVLAIAALVVDYSLARLHFQQPLTGMGRVALSASVAAFVGLASFACLEIALRLQFRHSIIRYLCQASFWVYMFHLPVVCLLQVELFRYRLPIEIKFAIVLSGALLASLVTYQACVRYSLLGIWVNGRAKVKSAGWRRRAPLRYLAWACAVLIVSGVGWKFHCIRGVQEVVEAGIYRSGRLSNSHLEDVIRRKGIRSVVNLRGGDLTHGWLADQHRSCELLGAQLFPASIPSKQLTNAELNALVRVIDACPKPVLFQGRIGIRRPAVAAAIAQLLMGSEPQDAKRQFSAGIGYLHGRAAFGPHIFLTQYEQWLDRENLSHHPSKFRDWAEHHYHAPAPIYRVAARAK